MIAAYLADILLLLHLLFIVFVIFGGLLVLYRNWVAWLHLPMMLWGVAINHLGIVCPLTPLENHFRLLAGQRSYPGGFIDRYITPLVYPAGFTSRTWMYLSIALLAWNLLLYGLAIYRNISSHETNPD